MCDPVISCILDQESFALNATRPNSTTDIFGILQIHSESLCFTPPVWTQVQLIGKEQIGDTCRTIVNDTYQLSTYPDDWKSCSSLSSSVDSTVSEYSLPFSFPVPSNIPTSFQIYDQQEECVSCRIYYTLVIKVSSVSQIVLQPVHFHRSNMIQCRSILFNQENITKEEEEEYIVPKRVFWGITKQPKQRWQYELEFPNNFDLVTCKSGSISLRLRSVSGRKSETKKGCCLIGCQIIQSIHLEGYPGCIQVLATSTKLITNPNKTWLKPCQVDFDFDDSALPTVDNQRLGVEHFIRVTVEFCNEESNEHDYCKLDLQFPIVFTGYTLVEQPSIKTARNQETNELQLSSSLSSISSYGETVALDIPPSSYKSLCNYLPYNLPLIK